MPDVPFPAEGARARQEAFLRASACTVARCAARHVRKLRSLPAPINGSTRKAVAERVDRALALLEEIDELLASGAAAGDDEGAE